MAKVPFIVPDIEVDGTTLTVDETNNRVGIGTNSPGVTLDVVGVIKGSDGVVTLTSAGAPSATVADGALAVDTTNDKLYIRTGGAWVEVSGGGGSGSSVTTSDTPPSSPAAGDLWYESDTGSFYIYYDSQWISISGTVPSATVISDADGDTKVQVEESADEDKIRFDTAGVERAVLDSSGLSVTGTIAASTSVSVNGTTINPLADQTNSTNVAGAIENITFSNVSGGAGDEVLIIDASDGGFKSVLWENLAVPADSLTGSALSSGVTSSSLTSVGTLSSLTVSGNLTVDTNTLFVNSTTNRVGIGTASPTAPLDVVGNIAVSGTVDGRDIEADGATLDAVATTYLPLTGGTLTGGLTGTTATFSGNLTVDTNTLFVNSTTNRVGIGTTSPATNLEVQGTGNTSITIDAPTGSYGIQYFAENGTNQWHYESAPGGGSWALVESNVAQRLTVLSGGNVGIGTTNPAQALDVVGAATVSGGLTIAGGKPVYAFVYVPTTDTAGSGDARLFDATYTSSGSLIYDLDNYDDSSFEIGGQAIANVDAILINVTVVPTTASGFVGVAPAGVTGATVTSTCNFTNGGDIASSLAFVTVDAGKQFRIYRSNPCRIICDLVALAFK